MAAPRAAGRALFALSSRRILAVEGAGAVSAAGHTPFLPRGLSTGAPADLPSLSDPTAVRALSTILAQRWFPREGGVEGASLAKISDPAAQDAIRKASAAAEAVEVFGEKLELLRMEMDELSGGKFGGEAVGSLPEHIKAALLSALRRYQAYLGSFGAEEEWLRRKVQEELGAQLLLLKQRCAGLETEWNEVSLIGTSGLSGSYIEKRSSKA